MRRNWDTIRAILLDAEEAPIALKPTGYLSPPELAEICADNHVSLLMSAGYLTEIDEALVDGGTIWLTWAGHELLEAIRNEAVWEQCQAAIALNGGGLPTDLLLEVARKVIRGAPAIARADADASTLGPLEPGQIVRL